MKRFVITQYGSIIRAWQNGKCITSIKGYPLFCALQEYLESFNGQMKEAAILFETDDEEQFKIELLLRML